MTLKSAKAIWDYLKGEYARDERIQSMQVPNLMREFELQRMKESETIKKYSDKLLSIANKIRLLDSDFADSRIVEKILVTILERYEASITSLENSKDLSKITLAEVLHTLMAQEQRRLMREDRAVEGALPTKHHDVGYNKKNFFKKNQPTSSEKSYLPCQYCRKMGHPPFRCWTRPDAKCNRCNQIRHEAVICKANIQQAVADAQNAQENVQQKNVAQVADEEEEQLFVATCFAISNSSEKWLINSGCTNHMTFDCDFFKELDTSIVSKVKIGKGEHIAVKGKGIVAIEITRPPPSTGAMKNVNRKVIRRSGTHKEDTQRQGLKQPHANIMTEESLLLVSMWCKIVTKERCTSRPMDLLAIQAITVDLPEAIDTIRGYLMSIEDMT
ncbi:hypothetical protein CR513_52432, partial [Mucuna pruriens]